MLDGKQTTAAPAKCEPGAMCDDSLSSAKILLAGKLTAMDSPGGGEIQMLALGQALREEGVYARLWRPWEDGLDEIGLLHLFGSRAEHLPVIEAARRHGTPVVLSTIAWFDLACYWRQGRGLHRRMAAAARFLARSSCPRLPSWRRRLYHAADLLLPNSNAEAQQLVRYFQVPKERIHVVPNGADERFARATADAFTPFVEETGFVLSPGRIEPRKNQLGLIRALRGTGVRVVILGDVVPGHEAYGRACRRAADDNVRFLARIDHHHPALAAAYAACGCLALTGWYETPGLVALEAAMSGVPLVAPRGGCAAEYFGEDASYVDSTDLVGIRRAVLGALRKGRNPALAGRVRRYFSWRAAARATCQAYEKVL